MQANCDNFLFCYIPTLYLSSKHAIVGLGRCQCYNRPLSSTVNDRTGCFLSPVPFSQPQKYKTGGSYSYSACYGAQVWPGLPTYSVDSSHTRSLPPLQTEGAAALLRVTEDTFPPEASCSHTLTLFFHRGEEGGGATASL